MYLKLKSILKLMENHIIPIDSIFRNQINFKNPNSFTYYLQDTMKNISYIRISSVELPIIYPNFNDDLNNNVFEIGRESGGEIVTDEIKTNNKIYSKVDDLVLDLKNNFNNILGLTNFNIEFIEIDGVKKIKISADQEFVLNFSCNNHPYIYQERQIINSNVEPADARKNYKLGNNIFYDRNTKEVYRMVVKSFISLNNKNINFLGNEIENISILTSQTSDLGKNKINYNIKIPPLGYYLGFRNKFYYGSNVYVAETVPNLYIYKYLLLKINDYGKTPTNHGDNEYLAKVILNDPRNPSFDNESNLLSKRHLFKKPEDIYQFKISIHDPFGNLVDLNEQDYSLTLELGEVNNSYLNNKFNDGHP